MKELSDNEKQLLAREAAADRSRNYDVFRTAFYEGWDAAMGYSAKIAAEGAEHLDEECCHFQD